MTAPLVTAPPCGNLRAGGYCFDCAHCKTRVCGTDWWALPRRELEARMLEAATASAAEDAQPERTRRPTMKGRP